MLRLTGVIELSDAQSGSVAITRATCKASVPLVGGKVEKFIGSQLLELLNAEQRFTTRWIADNH